ncbi:MAG: TolC family protein [Bacteroidales bacterium]
MTVRKKIFIGCILIMLAANGLFAQRTVKEITFDDFFQTVLSNNLELIVERYEVSKAEAALAAARVFEDPELEMIFPVFDEDEFSGFPRNIEFELEVPIELFGKRRNRIRQARAEKFAAQAGLDDFLRYLRTDAATTYIEVLSNQLMLERMNLNLEQLNQLLEVNQTLFEVGEIGEIDVLQTRVEVRLFQAEMMDAKMEFSDLMGEVYFLMGGVSADSLVFSGNIPSVSPVMNFQALRERALENRSDILLARRNLEASEFAMRLARSERLPDISLIFGYHNEEAVRPGPGFAAVYGGLIIPLKFSGFNSGEFRMSRIEMEQARVELQAATLDVESGLLTAWEKFQLMLQKRLLFTETILQDAERVRDAIVFSYQQGDVSLLEVLQAQNTLNEVYMSYYETLAMFAHSLVDLSREAGEWLVEF